MKKAFLFIASAAAILAGCAREVSFETPETGRKHITIQASVNPETKTTVDIEDGVGTYSWTNDEQIAVFESTATEATPFTVSDIENGYFDGDIVAGNTLLGAVSPYAAVTAMESGNGSVMYTLTLSGLYQVGETNAIMVAAAPQTIESDPDSEPLYKFQFKHAAGIMKVTYVNVPVGAAGLRFSTNKPITGSVDLETLTGVEIKNTDVNGESEAVVLFEAPVTEANTTAEFYVPVPTGSYTGFTICLIDDAGNAIPGTTKSKSTAFTVERSDIIRIPTVTLQAVEIVEGYVKVTSNDQVTAGDYLFVYEGGVVNNITYGPMALSGIAQANNSSYGTTKDVTITDNVIDETDNTDCNITVTDAGNGKYTLQLGSLYLAVNSDGNRLDGLTADVFSSLDDASVAEWTLTMNSAKNAKFSERMIQWNSNNDNPRFAAYKNTQKDIALYKKANGAVTSLIDPGLAFSQTSYSISIADVADFVAPSLTNEYGVKVTYSSSDEDLAVVDANTGEVVLSDENSGTVTITASSQATSIYSASTASYTVIIRATGTNTSTAENPYTPTQAIALAETIDETGEFEDVYVAGIVSKITYAYSSTNGNISYRISADGRDSEESDFITVFKGAASSANDILVGDYVVVKGTLLNYNGNTPELGEGTEVITNNRPSVVASPTSLEFTKDGGSKTVSVTMTGFAGTPAITDVNSSSNSFTATFSGNTVTVVAGANTSVAKTGVLTITAAYLGQTKSATVDLSQESGESGGDDDTPIDVTFNFATMGLTSGTQYSEFKDDDEIITVSFGDGANDGKYYDTGTGIRTYGNGHIKVSSPKTITAIKYYFQNANSSGSGSSAIKAYPNGDWEVSGGTFTEGATSSWSGSANEVVLTRDSGSGHWRLQKIVVTYLGQGNSGGGDDEPTAPETITFSELGLSNETQYTEPFDGGHFTITFAGGDNDGKYYSTGSGIRTYGGGTITIESELTISKIEFTWSGSNKPTSDVADPTGYSSDTGTWTGSAKSVVLTRPSGSGNWRLQAVKVTYAD